MIRRIGSTRPKDTGPEIAGRSGGAPCWELTRDAGLLAVCPVVALELLAAAATRTPSARSTVPCVDFAALHYDRHFESLRRVLGIDSVLIAPPGVLD